MLPMNVTAYQISKATGISETALGQIIKGQEVYLAKTP